MGAFEFPADADGDGVPDYLDAFPFDAAGASDADGDGMPDEWEVAHGLNPSSGLSDSLVGWWQFREGGGTNSADRSGFGHTAYILYTNHVCWADDAPVGAALRFDPGISGVVSGGNGGFVVVPGFSSMSLNTFTVAAWVRANTYPSYATIITKASDHDDWTDGFSLYSEDASHSLSFYAGNWGNGGSNCVFSGVGATGEWVHVCGTYDGTNASLYINGVFSGIASNVSGNVSSNDPLWIGSTFKNGWWLWDGEIADVRVYASALSPNAICGLLEFATDLDGDGVANIDEYLRNTNPSSSASVNRVLYSDSDVGSELFDGYYSLVRGGGRGPKETLQQAINASVSGDTIELRGGAVFTDRTLSPDGKVLLLRPVGSIRF